MGILKSYKLCVKEPQFPHPCTIDSEYQIKSTLTLSLTHSNLKILGINCYIIVSTVRPH